MDAPAGGTVECICDEVVCCGEAYEDDPGFCAVCANLDGEEHCPKCPCCNEQAIDVEEMLRERPLSGRSGNDE